mmetsp:Transcript_8107/g.19262  ORF Transcript_8107/g.19262 Transcript_8107/m.19262 type:complete len:363 (+) Transcript_8107:128-1216(+)|eukprot:CAMPEP_0182568222 /NCGR_PEP_ID=MMETSP1324-20130603/9237_1 /TAXON_ID=236786 /ORGANISM="Florenciella sp., Strain RCC1587" /LENGTH=362 /DNA_ID=CAMNT_0024782347 /DNA_START=67 /DNA_END=1155 /DNA_ORIENTATION=+
MPERFVAKLVLAIAGFSAASASLSAPNGVTHNTQAAVMDEWNQSNHARVKAEWATFKQTYSRDFGDEEVHRFGVFAHNLYLADERNERERSVNGTAVHGVTKFSDLTPGEFASRYLTTKVPEGGTGGVAAKEAGLQIVSRSLTEAMSGQGQDWTNTYTTDVKDQGYCGSCWAFSVSEQIESDCIRQYDAWYELSPQQITSCDINDSGCDGGWPTTAYEWVAKEGGLVAETDYPYTSGETGESGTCEQDKLDHKHVTVKAWYGLENEESMAAYMLDTTNGGPIAAVVDASQWQTYTGGVITSCGMDVDHAVQITGVSPDNSWKVRNSWGEDWGEHGYIFLAYGSDMCSITYLPTYVDTEIADP